MQKREHGCCAKYFDLMTFTEATCQGGMTVCNMSDICAFKLCMKHFLCSEKYCHCSKSKFEIFLPRQLKLSLYFFELLLIYLFMNSYI
jgi:hypothetical protein